MKFKLLFLSCAALIMCSPLQAMDPEDVEQKQQEIAALRQQEKAAFIAHEEQENRARNQMPQATAIDDSPVGDSPSVTASAKPLTSRQLKKIQKAEAQKRLEQAEAKKGLALHQTKPVEEEKEMGEESSSEARALKIETCKKQINVFIDNPWRLINSFQVGRLATDEDQPLRDLRVIDAQTSPQALLKIPVKTMLADPNNNRGLQELEALQDLLCGIEDRLQADCLKKAKQSALEYEMESAKEAQKFVRKQRRSEPKKKNVNPNVVTYSEFSDGVTKNLTDDLKTRLEEAINRLAEGRISGEHYIKGSLYRQEILHFCGNDYRIYFRRDVVINGSAKLVLLLFEKKNEQGGIAERADGAFERFCHEKGLDPRKYLDKR
jgi:hypothetical protein